MSLLVEPLFLVRKWDIGDIISTVVEKLKEVLGTLMDILFGAFKPVIDWVLTEIQKAIDYAVDTAKRIIENLFNYAYTFTSNIISSAYKYAVPWLEAGEIRFAKAAGKSTSTYIFMEMIRNAIKRGKIGWLLLAPVASPIIGQMIQSFLEGIWTLGGTYKEAAPPPLPDIITLPPRPAPAPEIKPGVSWAYGLVGAYASSLYTIKLLPPLPPTATATLKSEYTITTGAAPAPTATATLKSEYTITVGAMPLGPITATATDSVSVETQAQPLPGALSGTMEAVAHELESVRIVNIVERITQSSTATAGMTGSFTLRGEVLTFSESIGAWTADSINVEVTELTLLSGTISAAASESVNVRAIVPVVEVPQSSTATAGITGSFTLREEVLTFSESIGAWTADSLDIRTGSLPAAIGLSSTASADISGFFQLSRGALTLPGSIGAWASDSIGIETSPITALSGSIAARAADSVNARAIVPIVSVPQSSAATAGTTGSFTLRREVLTFSESMGAWTADSVDVAVATIKKLSGSMAATVVESVNVRAIVPVVSVPLSDSASVSVTGSFTLETVRIARSGSITVGASDSVNVKAVAPVVVSQSDMAGAGITGSFTVKTVRITMSGSTSATASDSVNVRAIVPIVRISPFSRATATVTGPFTLRSATSVMTPLLDRAAASVTGLFTLRSATSVMTPLLSIASTSITGSLTVKTARVDVSQSSAATAGITGSFTLRTAKITVSESMGAWTADSMNVGTTRPPKNVSLSDSATASMSGEFTLTYIGAPPGAE